MQQPNEESYIKIPETCPYDVTKGIYIEQHFRFLKGVPCLSMDKFVLAMGLLRILSGSIEISAALLMLKFNSIEKAFLINSSLVLVGPIILILTTSIGLSGIAGDISYFKILLIFLGIGLILYAVLSK